MKNSSEKSVEVEVEVVEILENDLEMLDLCEMENLLNEENFENFGD